jgi:hypothetical protein
MHMHYILHPESEVQAAHFCKAFTMVQQEQFPYPPFLCASLASSISWARAWVSAAASSAMRTCHVGGWVTPHE